MSVPWSGRTSVIDAESPKASGPKGGFTSVHIQTALSFYRQEDLRLRSNAV